MMKNKKVEKVEKTTKVEKVVNAETKNSLPVENQPNNDILQLQINELKAMITQLSSHNSQLKTELEAKSNVVEIPVQQSEIIDIPLNRVVKVVSLYNGGMTLKTAELGKTFRFENFGNLQPIIYADLIQIMSYQHRFTKQGYFMILDNDVVKAHALEDDYKKILTKQQIENILTFEDGVIRSLFSGTTNVIRETIVTMIMQKINSNEKKDYVDKNKVAILSEIYGKDIYALARNDVEAIVNNNI